MSTDAGNIPCSQPDPHQSGIALTVDLYKPTTSQKVNRNHDKHNNRHKQTPAKAIDQQQGKARPLINEVPKPSLRRWRKKIGL